MDSYDALSVFRAVVRYTTFQKLANETAPLLVHWTRMAHALAPEWDTWEVLRDKETEFKERLKLPIRELQKIELLSSFPAVASRDFASLHHDVWPIMTKLKRSELDNWAKDRLYTHLPWLNPDQTS